ncbi:MAG: hypothetical protein LBS20_11750 [Prevotella sp.]|jgi:hypothetical protein|nr:hypothetical protein [Prevotella sp.]
MATTKLNAEQFFALGAKAAGILLVYAGKEGKDTAQHFFGDDFVPKNKSENELFRVWKNIVKTMWETKREELKLREDNDGIRSKFRASTPTRIIIRNAKGELVKSYELDESVWAKIGLVPTKKDIDKLVSSRDYNKAIHAATKASFDALGFRVDLNAKPVNTVEEALDNAVKEAEAELQPAPVEAAA